MKYKMLGRTGLFVSEICLGTMTFGGRGELWPIIGQLDQAAATNLLRLSIEAGINFVDTADVYSEGESERISARRCQESRSRAAGCDHRHQGRAARTGPGPNAVGLSRGHIMDAVKASLDRLGTDHIDLYQIHGDDPVTPIEETLRRAGRSRARRPGPLYRLFELMAWQIMKALGLSASHGLGAVRNRAGLLHRLPAATSSARSFRCSRKSSSA